MKPKNMEKSFQPPIKLEVLYGNMLKGDYVDSENKMEELESECDKSRKKQQ